MRLPDEAGEPPAELAEPFSDTDETCSLQMMAMLRLLGLSAAAAATTPPAIVVIDVAAEFGMDYAGVQAAMGKARSVLSSGSSATVLFAAGTHHITMAGDLFNMTAMVAPPGGRLVIAGAGMDDRRIRSC